MYHQNIFRFWCSAAMPHCTRIERLLDAIDYRTTTGR